MSDIDERELQQGLLRKNLQGSTEKMANGINGLAEVTDNLIGITDAITEHTQKQMSAVENLMGGITDYSAIAEQVLATSQSSTILSENALAAAAQGKATVEESMQAMQRISQVVSGALRVIARLKEKAADIDENLRVIKDIGESTSMLSLNASIQSARAGQAGRGFAVVAQEVKRLAERSSSSVDHIQLSVDEVNASIANTVEALNVILQRVEEGTAYANSVAKIFDSIVSAAEETNSAFVEIAQAVSSQTHSLENVLTSTHGMNDSFESLAALVEVGGIYTNFTRNTLQALGDRAGELKKSTSKLTADRSAISGLSVDARGGDTNAW